MEKTKRQLRAEAVERLRGLGGQVQASSIQWALFGAGRDNMPPDELRDALIYLLQDDEPTNGITLPEGDAVSILREASGSDLSNLLLINTTCSYDVEEAYSKLADMIERDYVHREAYEDLRDEWREKAELFERERDGLAGEVCNLTEYISELMKKQPYTFDVHDARGALKTVGRYIGELESERDEWKAKAESNGHGWSNANMGWAKANAEAEIWRQKFDELKAKAESCNPCGWWNGNLQYCERDDGVKRSMTNLEWLCEHDRDAILHALTCSLRSCDGCNFRRYREESGGSTCDGEEMLEWLKSYYEREKGRENAPETPDFAEMPQETPEKGRENAPKLSGANLGSYCGTSEADVSTVAEVDTREKLEEFVRWRFPVLAEQVLECCDRQAAITERRVVKQGEEVSAQLVNDMNAARAERDYWKGQVQLCMNAAYHPGNAGQYRPEVMEYPEREGFTRPSTLVCDVIDGLRGKLSEHHYKAVDLKKERDELIEEVERQRKVIKTQADSFRKLEAEAKAAEEAKNGSAPTVAGTEAFIHMLNAYRYAAIADQDGLADEIGDALLAMWEDAAR